MAEPVAERKISPKAFLGHHAAAIAAGAIAAFALAAAGQWLLAPLAALPWLAVLAWAWIARAGTSYRLFDERLEVESGIIGRRIENVELFRIRDVGLRQGIFGRIGNFGDVYVHSTDSSTPDLHLKGIDAPREFYQQLRERVAESRAQSRTMIVEEGRATPEP